MSTVVDFNIRSMQKKGGMEQFPQMNESKPKLWGMMELGEAFAGGSTLHKLDS